MHNPLSNEELLEFLDHPADIQMHCASKSLPRLYEIAIKGMVEYAVEIRVTSRKEGRVEIENDIREAQLVDLLTYFIDLMYGEELVVVEVKILIDNNMLICDYVVTESFSCRKHCEIKAVTLCELKIFEKDGMFHLYCIFDV